MHRIVFLSFYKKLFIKMLENLEQIPYNLSIHQPKTF